MLNWQAWSEVVIAFEPNAKIMVTSVACAAVMGLLGGLFVPDDMTAWPALDRGDPTYLVDLNVWEARMPALWARVARASS